MAVTDLGVSRGELRVGAHVLVQLGAELVTDAEQALLECVKNAYDADAPGCRITIDTRVTGELLDPRVASEAFRFAAPSENVTVTVEDDKGAAVDPKAFNPDAMVRRHISYTGSVIIEDRGSGISFEGLERSWLVVSRSLKRVSVGPKSKTALGRTPLGDKGLGRLGTMKLGDILLVETATGPDEELSYAWFRWADCESAATVDEVPVVLARAPNPQKFKGTRVSVLGMRDIKEWRRPEKLVELTRALARLISPFEAAAAFPVTITLDKGEQSLGMVTSELLNKAVADFDFKWVVDDKGKAELQATARLSRRLFASERTAKLKERTSKIFGADNGRAFGSYLEKYRRLKNYSKVDVDADGRWFVEIRQNQNGLQLLGPSERDQPGPFSGAFYYYFFTPEDEQDDESGAVLGARAGLQTVRDLAGISILRDGFQIRNRGDWLELSAGMTSGSTYSLRPENTIGYFALSGERNWALHEKSDREGFVDDPTYRAFLKIAQACRDFANRALISSRRALDEYAKEQAGPPPMDAEGASRRLGEAGKAAKEIEGLGDQLNALLVAGGEQDATSDGPAVKERRDRAIALASKVVSLARSAVGEVDPIKLVEVINQEVHDARARNIALIESAAVGQAARGLTHELRTHLAEIRFRVGAIEGDKSGRHLTENVLSIRRSCSAIATAAAQIDPMLPRSRAVKDRFSLETFFTTYFEQRAIWLSQSAVTASASGASTWVKMNRARLLQVVDNLVRNSIFWLDKDPELQPRRIEVTIIPGGFILEDTGPGVEPLVEDSLFEMFVSTRSYEDGGQGLGLFISSELLGLDGCSIALLPDRNSSGRRYRFHVDLVAVTERT
jgi:signal transduction histidine kinase